MLGLPDLYDTDYAEGVTVETPGDWSVMASGSYNLNGCIPPLYSSYEQWVCRWLEFTEAEDAVSYAIPALGTSESPKAIRIGIPKSADGGDIENEYFIVEARDNSGWDKSFPESGLIVWRINYNKNNWINNTVNSAKGSNVVIHHANGVNHPAFTEGHIIPGTSSELIPSKDYAYWKSPIITDISYDADSKTGCFDFNVLSEAPKGAPLLHDNPFADESGARNFTLQWDPVEGATDYQLTIKRTSTGKVLGVYDEFKVGDVTSFKVISVPIGYWNNEIEAYVRAVKVIPCSDTSNVVRFTPKNIPVGDNNAVDGIESDNVAVSGGVGCVNAPDEAQVFDMSGKLLHKNGLSAGVYIVVYAGRSYKVLVR
ncbi:MAG: hypothetical protein K2L00_05020 [Muribaculaceae bacterium]|nr:hypothetical protein [Muribaculaceae bacterium]